MPEVSEKIIMKIRYKIYILLFLLINLVFAGWFFLIGPKANEPGSTYNQGKNAVWIRHDWAEEEMPEVAIRQLVNKLVEHQIYYVFVHVGPLEKNGILPTARYVNAERFLTITREELEAIKDSRLELGMTEEDGQPDLTWLAWVGQLRSKLTLEKKTTRRNIVRAASTLKQAVSFDGVHYNIEPVDSGDEYFLKLLEETREAFGEKTGLISVAADEWQPEFLTQVVGFILNRHSRSYWNTEYYRQVAERVNQIVVMTYDTHFDQPWLYRWWVEQQLLYVDRAMGAVDSRSESGMTGAESGMTEIESATEEAPQLLIGIPAYEDDKESFNPLAENVTTGLEGVINGMNNLRGKTDNFVGVAVYPMWEIEDEEWWIWDRLWLGKKTKDEVITEQLFGDL